MTDLCRGLNKVESLPQGGQVREYRVAQNVAKIFAVCSREAQTDRHTLEGPCKQQQAPFVTCDADV